MKRRQKTDNDLNGIIVKVNSPTQAHTVTLRAKKPVRKWFKNNYEIQKLHRNRNRDLDARQ